MFVYTAIALAGVIVSIAVPAVLIVQRMRGERRLARELAAMRNGGRLYDTSIDAMRERNWQRVNAPRGEAQP